MTVAVALLAVGEVGAPIFGGFPGLTKLISKADSIVLAYFFGPHETDGMGGGGIQTIHVIESLKGDLSKDSKVQAHLRPLPFVARFGQERSWDTLMPKGFQPGQTYVFFLIKNPDPKLPVEYRSMNLSGDMFWVAPGHPGPKQEGIEVRQYLNSLLRHSIKAEKANLEKYQTAVGSVLDSE